MTDLGKTREQKQFKLNGADGNNDVAIRIDGVDDDRRDENRRAEKAEPEPEDGCVGRYVLFSLRFWIVARGWISLATTLTAAASTVLSGMNAIGTPESGVGRCISVAATVTGSVCLGLRVIQGHASRTVEERREEIKSYVPYGTV